MRLRHLWRARNEQHQLRRSLRRGAVVVLAGLGTALIGATPALAHASLVGATPADGATVTTAPHRAVLRFDENIRTPATVIVTGPSGRVDRGPTRVVNNTAGVAVRITAQPDQVGPYTVAYRVVSADGHPVSGETTFSFRPPGVAPVAGTSQPAHRTGAHGAGAGPAGGRWLLLGAAVAVVAAVALLLIGRGRFGRGRS